MNPEPGPTNAAHGENTSVSFASAITKLNQRRVMLAGGFIFFVVLTVQYLKLATESPTPLVWQRSPQMAEFCLDINTATWIEWIQLPEIGPSLAHRIVADRELNGPFRSVEDLQRVEGIGKVTLQKIGPWLTCAKPDKDTAETDSRSGPAPTEADHN